ncbi:Formin-like protein 6 [Cucumis melo var. makuwa]|uniref:Formin-like protein 6 n=2 Tax=Cucumis melo TaxID=3656 RepID=A0A5A7SYW9_CUCMM|nr:Formin-like protein 6 [Cucumis melo var. makuwa]TYK12818.1 Formin-like protein 6 [Cucumis melo var. makuwa]
MKISFLIFILSLDSLVVLNHLRVNADSWRRSLHQPLDPATFSSPPSPPPPPPPPLESAHSDQPTPAPSNVSLPNLPSSGQQSFKPIKTLGIVCSVAIVTLGMLSALAFFLYRQRIKYRYKSRMLVEKERSLSFRHDSGIPPSSFLNYGTMERRPGSIDERKGRKGEDESSPDRRVDSVKKLDSHLLSPELQPLPPLSQNQIVNPSFETPLSDDESRETVFHTPEWAAAVPYSGGKRESRNNLLSVEPKGTSPLPYLEGSLIKQDHRRPAASPPPHPTAT